MMVSSMRRSRLAFWTVAGLMLCSIPVANARTPQDGPGRKGPRHRPPAFQQHERRGPSSETKTESETEVRGPRGPRPEAARSRVHDGRKKSDGGMERAERPGSDAESRQPRSRRGDTARSRPTRFDYARAARSRDVRGPHARGRWPSPDHQVSRSFGHWPSFGPSFGPVHGPAFGSSRGTFHGRGRTPAPHMRRPGARHVSSRSDFGWSKSGHGKFPVPRSMNRSGHGWNHFAGPFNMRAVSHRPMAGGSHHGHSSHRNDRRHHGHPPKTESHRD